MPVKLYSGLPGAGKTAQVVAEICRRVQEEPDRPVYAMGINGLAGGLAELLTQEQVENWWTVLPPGSVIVLDEAQEDHLMPLDHGKPKDWVKRIRKVRHAGMDFILTCQHPADLSASVRRLVDQHVHTVRKFNTGVTIRYTWPRCINDPEEERQQKKAIVSPGVLPKEIFALYKSAMAHNMKRRIPRKFYIMIAFFLLAIGAAVGLPFALNHMRNQTVTVATGSGGAASSPGPRLNSPSAERADLRTSNYVQWQTPRLPGVPWSAPMYDNLSVRSEPAVYCIAVDDGRCFCRTEQGTKYDTPAATCRAIAGGGIYNPFKAPIADQPAATAGQLAQTAQPAHAGQPSPPVTAGYPIGGSSLPVSSVIPQVYTPPEQTAPNT